MSTEFRVYAPDVVMDQIEAIKAKPEAERTADERSALSYAEGHNFRRYGPPIPRSGDIYVRRR